MDGEAVPLTAYDLRDLAPWPLDTYPDDLQAELNQADGRPRNYGGIK
jgi:hypothetical protein